MRPARPASDLFCLLCDPPALERDCPLFEVRDCALRLERDCAPVLRPEDFVVRFAGALRDERDDAPRLLLLWLAPAVRERPEVERELEDARAVRD
jgi:hypothetical protein